MMMTSAANMHIDQSARARQLYCNEAWRNRANGLESRHVGRYKSDLNS